MRKYATQFEKVYKTSYKWCRGMIAENLFKLRKQLNFGQNEFSLKLGINPRAYINYERGERKPPYELLIKLSDEYNVNLNWLITNKGDMFNAPQYEDVKGEILKEVDEILVKYGVKNL